MTLEKMAKKKYHNSLMIEIASALNDLEFDDVKNCANAKKMWDKLALVHGGDPNLLRAKVESLRGKYDDMRMKEGENVVHYVNQIKEVVSAIKVDGGFISYYDIVSNVLRTLLPIYVIKFFVIQEVRVMTGNDLTLDGLVGRLTTFELSNYDNSMVTLGNYFKSSLTIGSSKKENISKDETKYKSKGDIDDIEALLARRLSRGKDKFKGKLPLIYFKCDGVGHFVGKCPNRERVTKMIRKIKSIGRTRTRKINEINHVAFLKKSTPSLVLMVRKKQLRWCMFLLRKIPMEKVMKVKKPLFHMLVRMMHGSYIVDAHIT
jgi:hypothetical protein